MSARYHLRFQIHPTADAAEDATALAKFCDHAGVEEVVLLTGAEELFPGHLDRAAEDRWFQSVRTAQEVLLGSGLQVSLNPWATVGHADRGRVDRAGFAPMVGPDGDVAEAQASFACPRWRDWLAAHYGRFAELGFRVLWLEDDFRYHNHAPLRWGGGFEPLMLERFAALAGEEVSRERLVAAITAPGTPHRWRGLLQQVWRTAQLEVAELVARVVADASDGRSRLGLMSSEPGAHSVEGRDWTALFERLGIAGQAAHRPHFAAYSDAPGRELSRSVWMLELQRALRPAAVSSEPELENWPHTAWSKADTQAWSELVAAQLAGSDAMMLNVHPMHGRRAERFPRVGELLRRSRPALDWVAERYPRDQVTDGVGLPFRPDAAAQVRTRRGDLAELAVDPGPTADFLLRYGVPVTARSAPVRALFGQLAWAFFDDELRAMLAGGLLLDGVAAEVLTARGFADLIGVRVDAVVDRNEHVAPGPYSAELVTGEGASSPVTRHHLPAGTWLSVNVQPALARVEPLPGTAVWTEVVTPDGAYWGAGRCVAVNGLGGRVAVLASTAPAELPFDDDGRLLVHAMVRFLEGDRPRLPLVSGGPHLIPHLSESGGVRRLAVANGSADPARVRVDLPPDRLPDSVTGTLLAPLASPEPCTVARAAGGLDAERQLPHRGWLVLDHREGVEREGVE
ncbi:hypothetical protein [Streptacidiphilus sp. EB129]|uniref:hypothetical protein n=1 Tax=Streptacidiphilus sp. EB129 TaxID=3156262 RepID=UPI0035138C2D